MTTFKNCDCVRDFRQFYGARGPGRAWRFSMGVPQSESGAPPRGPNLRFQVGLSQIFQVKAKSDKSEFCTRLSKFFDNFRRLGVKPRTGP